MISKKDLFEWKELLDDPQWYGNYMGAVRISTEDLKDLVDRLIKAENLK